MEERKQTIGIIAQYIKDLSFENVNSFARNSSSDEQPQIDVQLKVNIEESKTKNVFFVSLIIKISAKLDKPLFVLELNYIGEFLVEDFPEDMMGAVLYVECPKLLFPFARSIIATTVSEGGFPTLYLAPINFADIYQQQEESKNHSLQ